MVITELEAALANQVRLGGDPEIGEAADALLTALRPAVSQLVAGVAEQAAAEIGAQLPDRSVRVELSGGRPVLVVGTEVATPPVQTSGLEARLTLRLPEALKKQVEAAASEAGESVNTFVVKTLGGLTRARSHRSQGSFRGTIET